MCITSQDEEKVESARARTGATNMAFVSDYNKVYASHFKLNVVDAGEKGSEWHHKDNTMSQPAVIVLAAPDAQVTYSWVSKDSSLPFGRPDPTELWEAMSHTLAKDGSLVNLSSNPVLASLNHLDQQQTMALMKAAEGTPIMAMPAAANVNKTSEEEKKQK